MERLAHKVRLQPKDCQSSENWSQTGVQLFEVQNDKNVSENMENKKGFSVHLCEFLGVGQIVHSNGQEDVEQRVCGGVKETRAE